MRFRVEGALKTLKLLGTPHHPVRAYESRAVL